MGLLGGHSITAWVLFNVLILGLLVLDLGVFNRRMHVIGFREALFWNIVWTSLGLAFSVLFFSLYGRQSGLEYLTGYVIERALSVDNIFVFVVVLEYFRVRPEFQHRVLFWGILGALVMRGALIIAGAALVAMFHWVLYIFGAFLVVSGFQLLLKQEEPPHPEKNPVVRLAQRFLPVDPTADGARFVVRKNGRLHATTMMIVLIVIETTDLVFALDSIPAIFGVTRDPFVIYTSNVFAILGLRAMYFLIAALLPRFRFLKHGLSVVLILIGLRMLADRWIEIPTALTLAIVCAILAAAVLASMLLVPKRTDRG